jgi:prepilin signal peptidase PulO-like enzyme (type II secretory pathway)
LDTLVQLPMEVRLAGLFVVGLLLGGLVNWGIYWLAWDRRHISPWSPPPEKMPPRRWSQRLPVIGWLGLRHEAKVHGRGFWIRPMLIDLAMGIGLAALYAWEVSGGLLGERIPAAVIGALQIQHMLHAQFLAHAVLFVLLMAATFIDFDELTIPDAITMPGTLVGLTIVALLPSALLPAPVAMAGLIVDARPLLCTSSPDLADWPAWLDRWEGLALGLLGYCGWCLALTPATVTRRRGLMRGVWFFWVSIVRRGLWRHLVALVVLGCVGIVGIWWLGGDRWRSLLSAIAGIVFGGGLVWSVRIVGSVALHKEAMGFGDVTLMGMIGAFVGWQATWIIFFVSPMAAVVVAIIGWLLTRRRDLPYGPYLALATAVVVVKWAPIWDRFAAPIFQLGWYLPAILAACLMLMMGLLMLFRMTEEALFSGKDNKRR